MMKLIAIALTMGLISGCNTIRVKGEVQEVKVPLLYCPAPPSFTRPFLEINQLTDQELMSDGKITQAYAASVLQLLGYTKSLEEALMFYDDANLAFEELEEQLRTFVPTKTDTGVP